MQAAAEPECAVSNAQWNPPAPTALPCPALPWPLAPGPCPAPVPSLQPSDQMVARAGKRPRGLCGPAPAPHLSSIPGQRPHTGIPRQLTLPAGKASTQGGQACCTHPPVLIAAQGARGGDPRRLAQQARRAHREGRRAARDAPHLSSLLHREREDVLRGTLRGGPAGGRLVGGGLRMAPSAHAVCCVEVGAKMGRKIRI